MNKWKASFLVALILLVVSNAYQFYHVIDVGISYSYLHDEYTSERARFERLGRLVVASSNKYTKADILHLLRQADKDAFIVDEESSIYFDGINFIFVGDRLVEVN